MAASRDPDSDPHPELRLARRTATGHEIVTANEIRGRNFTEEGRKIAKELFIEGYLATGTIRGGCANAGVARETFNDWRESDAEFDKRYKEAVEEFNDRIREEITRRAAVGVERTKKVFYKGMLIDEWVEREYSDTLLALQARARMKEYRQEQVLEEEDGKKLPMGTVRDILRDLPEGEIAPDFSRRAEEAAEQAGAGIEKKERGDADVQE